MNSEVPVKIQYGFDGLDGCHAHGRMRILYEGFNAGPDLFQETIIFPKQASNGLGRHAPYAIDGILKEDLNRSLIAVFIAMKV
ncbi:hypothetical protein JCM12296A_01230 [Desulfosarcina cetonica]